MPRMIMKFWIYQDGAQKGPFTVLELFEKNVTTQTPVWCEGMDKWRQAGDVPALGPMLDGNRDFYLSEGAVMDEATVEENTPADQTGKVEENTLTDQTVAEKTPAASGSATIHPVETPAPAAQTGAQAMAAVKARYGRPEEPCPPTYIGWSVFLTVCCCSPLSIAALVCSIFVPSYYNKGKLDKSRRASEIAAWLIMIAIALGFLPVMLMSAIF